MTGNEHPSKQVRKNRIPLAYGRADPRESVSVLLELLLTFGVSVAMFIAVVYGGAFIHTLGRLMMPQ